MAKKNELDKPAIGLVMKSLAAEFFQNMQAAAIAHAQLRGDITLIPVGTESQTEVDMQVNLVRELMQRGVDALVVIPIDSEALVEPVAQAVRAGIKVVNADVMLDQERLRAYQINPPFVGPDHILAAKVAGDLLARQLSSAARVVIIDGIPNAINAQQRRKGFLLSAEQNGLVIIDSRSANWETEWAAEVFSALLDEHPDLEGVMCANDAMALGVMHVLEQRQLDRRIYTVGIDNDDAVRPLIKNGTMLATIDLLGAEMVVRSIDYAVDALLGKERRGWIKTPIQVVTRETVTELSF